MTVRELIAFLATCDADATVYACSWSDEDAIRVFSKDYSMRQLRWRTDEDEA